MLEIELPDDVRGQSVAMMEVRNQAGLSQEALAARLGVSQPKVAAWEGLIHSMKVRQLVALMRSVGGVVLLRQPDLGRELPSAELPESVNAEPIVVGSGPGLARALRVARTERGWTQLQVAAKLRTGQAVVSRHESGRPVPAGWIAEYARLYGVPIVFTPGSE